MNHSVDVDLDHDDGLTYSVNERTIHPGSFYGHSLAGGVMFVYGLFRTYMILREYYMIQRAATLEPQKHLKNRTYYSWYSYPTRRFPRLPIDIWLSAFVAVPATVYEVVVGIAKGTGFPRMENIHHLTLYYAMVMPMIVYLFQYYRGRVVPGLEYMATALAFMMEGLIFHLHVAGRTPLNKEVHLLLFYTVMGVVFTTLLEYKYRRSVLIALSRCFFIIMHGLWLCQLAWFLSSPFIVPFDQHSHHVMMYAAIVYIWDYAGIFCSLIFIASCVKKYFGAMNKQDLDQLLNIECFEDIIKPGSGAALNYLPEQLDKTLEISPIKCYSDNEV